MEVFMANDILSVEPNSSGLFIRFSNGGCRTISVGPDAELIHYTNDGITYKQRGQTKYFNHKTNGVRVL